MPGSLSYAVVARGAGTHLSSVVCTLGCRDRPYPEVHESAAWTIALVRRGTFRYRGSATDDRPALRPGWLLLGAPGAAFECWHEHDGGDACASLVVPAEVVEDALATVPRAARETLATHAALPPEPAIAAVLERACRAGAGDLDEVGCVIAESLAAHAARTTARDLACGARDVARAHDAMARIEASCATALSLGELAREAGLSPFHFLRLFRRVAGVTPYQYLIGARLRRALDLLLDTELPVTRVAYDSGFGDLSNFNHTFRRVIGGTPRAYRRGRGTRAPRSQSA